MVGSSNTANTTSATCLDLGLSHARRGDLHWVNELSVRLQAPSCTGMPFYHWGALTGYLSLLEAGLY